MNVCVFDTETTSLEKPFCYNIGFIIGNTDNGEILVKKEFVIDQIWQNKELFSSAYYANKRPFYVSGMRARKIQLDKWGFACQRMARLLNEYDVVGGYAYNSSFDEKVFNFNSEWFKTLNPIENIPIYDIRGYVHAKIAWQDDFRSFCEKNNRFTESGNYSTTAETVFQYFSKDSNFKEDHTALSDSIIEWEILKKCVSQGLEWGVKYKTYASIPRNTEKELEVITLEQSSQFFDYRKISIRKGIDKTTIILK